MTRLSLWLLGPFLAELDGEPLSGFRSDKVRALLAYLCVEAHRPWSRGTLIGLLWPDIPEENARSNLRNALSNLHRVLGDQQADPPYLHVSRSTLQFNSASNCWLDVRAFLGLLPTADQDQDVWSDPAELARLEQAIALYRGDFLEGFALDAAPFEEWILVTRQQFRQKLMATVRLLALGHAQLGDLAASSRVTRRWLELEPWEEAAHRHMMQLLALRGQRSAALAQYKTCRQSLSLELGIEPELETVRLYEQIRDGRPDTPFAILSPPAGWPGPERRVPHWLPQFLTAEPTVAGEPVLFVDREPELATLTDALARAASGQGAVCFVTGEPGSGKTALLAEFARRALARDPELLVAWGQCSAFTGQGDPYFPFLNIMRMLAGDAQVPGPANGISPEHRLRLWRHLPATVDALLDHGPDLMDRFISARELLALARLHSGVKLDRLKRLQRLVQQPTVQPPRQRVSQAALFEQFTRVLCALAQRRPLVLVVDDMQWIDPGSVDLLFHLARGIAGSKILLLGAYRPEEASLRRQGEPHPLPGVIRELQRAFDKIQLDLMQSQGSAFVAAFLDSEPNELSREFRALLYRHTSGNPLFTVELLRGMQLRGEIRRNKQGRWVEGPQLDWSELPERVEAVIAGRIGHLSPACQELLSVASVEGEQFTAEVMADVLHQDAQQIRELLSQEAGKQHRMVAAETTRHVGEQNLALYRFRHALFQTYLYHHLDVVEKARLHGLVAQKLEEVYQRCLDQFPEMPHSLARHFEAAGLAERAVRYYTRAGKNALRLSANREAIAHFYNALRLLQALPATPERDRQELDLQLSLGPPLTATKGWAPPEMAAAYARAQELCETIDDPAQLIPALWLLATYRVGRSEHAEAGKLSERLYRLAEQQGDPAFLTLASLQVSSFYRGKFAEARRLLERASAVPDVQRQRDLAQQYGLAPAVVALAYLGECLWLLGFPDQASQRMQEARELAKQVQHPMAACYALGRSCWLAAVKGVPEEVRGYAAALEQVAEEFGLENFALAARFWMQWAANQAGTPSAGGITHMHQALEAYHATGTVLNRTAFLAFFAQACGTAGQIARGLAAVDESLALAEETGEMWFQAESLRVKGELLRLQAGEQAQPEAALRAAEACFETARQVAEQQGAKSFEGRAVESLRLLRQGQLTHASSK
jgi:DNA-binding SARP family transcriptional activator